jgi:hypothetical protein
MSAATHRSTIPVIQIVPAAASPPPDFARGAVRHALYHGIME